MLAAGRISVKTAQGIALGAGRFPQRLRAVTTYLEQAWPKAALSKILLNPLLSKIETKFNRLGHGVRVADHPRSGPIQ